MLLKAILVIGAIFALAFVARFVALLRDRPWMAPALAGVCVWGLTWKLGVMGVALAAAAFGVVWWLRRPRPGVGVTDEAQARALLGVAEGASADAIRAAHRAAIRQAHPDKGGAHERAAALNAARDLLVKRARKR
jgi:hypothetical protein